MRFKHINERSSTAALHYHHHLEHRQKHLNINIHTTTSRSIRCFKILINETHTLQTISFASQCATYKSEDKNKRWLKLKFKSNGNIGCWL